MREDRCSESRAPFTSWSAYDTMSLNYPIRTQTRKWGDGQSLSKADASLQPLSVIISVNFDPVSRAKTVLCRKSQHLITAAQSPNGMRSRTPDENPPLSQTFQSILPFQHASWRFSGPLGVSQRRATSGGVVSGCPRTRLTRQDGLCNLTSSEWRPWSASGVFRHLLFLISTISHRFTLWNTSSGVTELSKPVHLGDVILLPAWVWPWLVVCHLPSIPVSCSTHIRHNLHLWPAGWGAAGVGAGDHGLKRQEAL